MTLIEKIYLKLRLLFILCLAVCLSQFLFCFTPPAHAAAVKYDTLLEQGLFYLEKGASYGKDAARVLEEAQGSNPERAAADIEFLSALARAYFLTSRYSETYWILEQIGKIDELSPQNQELRNKLLNESGLGKLKISSATPLEDVGCELVLGADSRLDVASKNILNILNELIKGPFSTDLEGVTILAPESSYELTCSGASIWPMGKPLLIDVWSGEQASAKLTARYPQKSQWRIGPGSRSISLSWPPLENIEYRLYRIFGGSEELIYEGDEPKFVDSGLTVGVSLEYRIEYLEERSLIAASTIKTATMPAVKQVNAKASLNEDFTVTVEWSLGAGAADRLRVVRRDADQDRVLLDDPAADIETRRISDGPFTPQEKPVKLEYEVEALLEGSNRPVATARTTVEVPPLIERVVGLTQSIDRGAIVLMWETLPREGVADGYAIFRQGDKGVEAVLVGRVEDPFAKEFEYQVEDPLAASDSRHTVVPYVGDRYILDPERITASGEVPKYDKAKHKRVITDTLPDLALAWDSVAGARKYEIVAGNKTVLVSHPYLEIEGLQSPLMGTQIKGEIFSVNAKGEKVRIITFELQYEDYKRSKEPGD